MCVVAARHGLQTLFREWSLCEDLVDERPQFDGSDRLAHGTAADLNDNLGTDIDVVVKSGMIGHLDDFRVGRRHGGDVHGHRKRILGNAVPDELFRQVILQPFPDKRAGGTAQFVAYLSLRQLSVVNQDIHGLLAMSASSDIRLMRCQHLLRLVPPLKEICSA